MSGISDWRVLHTQIRPCIHWVGDHSKLITKTIWIHRPLEKKILACEITHLLLFSQELFATLSNISDKILLKNSWQFLEVYKSSVIYFLEAPKYAFDDYSNNVHALDVLPV